MVDDLYLRAFGHLAEPPPFDRAGRPPAGPRRRRRPAGRAGAADADAGSAGRGAASIRRTPVRAEMDRRKRRLGILSYDDLLSRLADALEAADAPARERMRQRWRIVLVDEFQDTDPVQWQVLDRAFHGHATLVLIGDPKQAIYAFRGGDIVTYLEAPQTAATERTLATNWRSDAPLVDALQVLLGGAAAGRPRITRPPGDAHHPGSRLAGAPRPHPLRRAASLRGDVSTPRQHGLHRRAARRTSRRPRRRRRPAARRRRDVRRHGRSGRRRRHPHRRASSTPALPAGAADRGVPSVVSGGSNVLRHRAGDQWLALLEALEQPHRTGRIRAVALTAVRRPDRRSSSTPAATT